MKFLLPLLLCSCTTTAVAGSMLTPKYNLPMEIDCLGRPIQGQGLMLCAQMDAPKYLKVKIPPTKGQLRVTDCNQDLTVDGNPDDFNTKLEKQGWWIFGRTVRVMNDTPSFQLPQHPYNNCAIAVAVSAEDTGVQVGVVLYDTRNGYDDSGVLEVACASESNFQPVTRMTTCTGLAGAKLIFRVNPKKAIPNSRLLVLASDKQFSCNMKQDKTLVGTAADQINTKISEGVCVYDMAWVKSPTSVVRVRVGVLGKVREDRELDNPLAVAEDDNIRVYKPIGATVMSSELYELGHVLWKSQPHTEDSYVLNPKESNANGRKTWGYGTVLCHTAYSSGFNSFSGTCYKADGTNQEVPYFFR